MAHFLSTQRQRRTFSCFQNNNPRRERQRPRLAQLNWVGVVVSRGARESRHRLLSLAERAEQAASFDPLGKPVRVRFRRRCIARSAVGRSGIRAVGVEQVAVGTDEERGEPIGAGSLHHVQPAIESRAEIGAIAELVRVSVDDARGGLAPIAPRLLRLLHHAGREIRGADDGSSGGLRLTSGKQQQGEDAHGASPGA